MIVRRRTLRAMRHCWGCCTARPQAGAHMIVGMNGVGRATHLLSELSLRQIEPPSQTLQRAPDTPAQALWGPFS